MNKDFMFSKLLPGSISTLSNNGLKGLSFQMPPRTVSRAPCCPRAMGWASLLYPHLSAKTVIQIYSYIESDSNPRFHSSNGTNIRRLRMCGHCLWLRIAIFHIKVTDRVSDSISWLILPSYSLAHRTKQCTRNYYCQTACSSHVHVLPV
jgi:hypothetical protein